MENIEFIAAKDLPTTEAEEVDVLCVEGGELKRKPGASLGGSDKWDAVITVTFDDEGGEPLLELTSGSYDALREKILADDVPKIKTIQAGSVWHSSMMVLYVEACEDTEEDEAVWVVLSWNDGLWVGIRPDNTMFLD